MVPELKGTQARHQQDEGEVGSGVPDEGLV